MVKSIESLFFPLNPEERELDYEVKVSILQDRRARAMKIFGLSLLIVGAIVIPLLVVNSMVNDLTGQDISEREVMSWSFIILVRFFSHSACYLALFTGICWLAISLDMWEEKRKAKR